MLQFNLISSPQINELLESKGLYVEHVLTRFPNFHKEVQAKIEGRNLQEQTKYMNIAKAGEAAVESELKKIVQEGKSLVDIKLMKGTNYMTRKSAEMQAYEKIKKSEADKIVKLAEAEKTKKINDSYQGTGSERLVGMEMADVLKGLDAIIIQAGGEKGFNPLDLEAGAKEVPEMEISKAFQLQQKPEGNAK